eukprot:TRINITY_DN16084_c0_g2_i1.p1 TRINITY_DN16084_c0_g2~~TRINITY_DN16084_c0_g2_i1.p1  ORF type:complete len:128 (-),score=23.93 TRINITY_DN16084_c0_g2_i1:42-380(-)
MCIRDRAQRAREVAAQIELRRAHSPLRRRPGVELVDPHAHPHPHPHDPMSMEHQMTVIEQEIHRLNMGHTHAAHAHAADAMHAADHHRRSLSPHRVLPHHSPPPYRLSLIHI